MRHDKLLHFALFALLTALSVPVARAAVAWVDNQSRIERLRRHQHPLLLLPLQLPFRTEPDQNRHRKQDLFAIAATAAALLCAAVTSEFVQAAVSTRAFDATDIAANIAGVALGLFVATLCSYRNRNKHYLRSFVIQRERNRANFSLFPERWITVPDHVTSSISMSVAPEGEDA
ncbi:hypothetical protein HK100_012121 [Physocladia obscura]|uniref:VanZ-like domain-containing protein n=1 Tax=Physocladia obscura TaxID=109957 RepID=A0AAD5XHU3_9FUNG|nr:hypothetical protein HK100_012121 [Physocladia obscura]